MMYGCETWILTKALIEKLEIYARTCYRIMLSIKQSRPRDKPKQVPTYWPNTSPREDPRAPT